MSGAKAIFVGEIVDHSLRATGDGDNATVYLSLLCQLRNGQGCEAQLFFSERAKDIARATLKTYGMPEDPRRMDERSGKDFVSMVGKRVLIERVEKEYQGKPQVSWFLAKPKDGLANKSQIEAVQRLMKVTAE